MEDFRPLKTQQWVSSVLAFSNIALTRLGRFDPDHPDFFSDFGNSVFWDLVDDPPSVRTANASDRADINRSIFVQVATEEERRRFIVNQQNALNSLNEAIMAIDQTPLEALKTLTLKYKIEPEQKFKTRGRYPDRLIDHILQNKQVFDQNPNLHFLTRFAQIAFSILEGNSTITKVSELCVLLSRSFMRDYQADMNDGKIRLIMYPATTDLEKEAIETILLDRRDLVKSSGLKVIAAVPNDPNKIRPSDDAKIEFAKETNRPSKASGGMKGGRAGWGKQKPDLWKPENK